MIYAAYKHFQEIIYQWTVVTCFCPHFLLSFPFILSPSPLTFKRINYSSKGNANCSSSLNERTNSYLLLTANHTFMQAKMHPKQIIKII